MNKPKRDFPKAILTAPMTRQEAEQVCAVEGLHLSPELTQLFEQAERDGATHDELQRRIDAAFGF